MRNQLKEEFDEFLKEKEEMREIIGKIGGSSNSEYKLISSLFLGIIVIILIAGIILRRITPTTTLLIAILLAAFKIIWMMQQASKSMHFQFWILNSLEIRINEIDKKIRKIEKTTSLNQDENVTVEKNSQE